MNAAYQKVLIVDDDQETAEFLEELVTNLGLAVIVAHSAREAKTILQHETVGLMIVDNLMPGMTGTALVRDLRREGRKNPIILFSGCLPAKVDALRQELHLVEVLEKPLEPKVLVELILRHAQTAS